MRVVDSFPHEVREIEHVWIPMSDGCRLAARLWIPKDADRNPVPAILEYIPYGKREGTRERDDPMHRYFAGHGYAAVRVDIRGAGDSDGLLLDEYLPQEQEDAVEVIRWIAGQPWCSGAVGMMGKSWGGFNSLQVAALAPPELRAILTVCSTDDRYADDAHYMGGCLLNENLVWGSVLFTMNAIPPDPELVGEGWRATWVDRLAAARPFPIVWLEHQRRDDYWKQGSVCEDFSRIRCPVYVVGGWADGYTNAVPRLLAGLRVPRRGLVGPWAHVYPHQGAPGPAIGFLQEALRWWDQWLAGRPNEILDEPMLRAWMQESVPPRGSYAMRPGRWVAESTWPSPRIRWRRLFANADGLAEASGVETEVSLAPRQSVGLAAGAWCGFGVEGEAPRDQREDDAASLVFDSEPLAERTEILGAPVATLDLSVDRRLAFVAVRLNDVAADGSATRVTYGLLNLTHRNGHGSPTPIEPGKRMTVVVKLNDVAHAFPQGHRLRLAISTSYWPVVWPSPEPVRLTVVTGTSHVEIPVRPPDPGDRGLRSFDPPEAAPPVEQTDLDPGGISRSVERDPKTGEVVYQMRVDLDESGRPALARVDPIDLVVGHGLFERFSIRDGDPLSARAEVEQTLVYRRGEWSTRARTWIRLSSSAESFLLEAKLEAWEGRRSIFRRRWRRKIEREV